MVFITVQKHKPSVAARTCFVNWLIIRVEEEREKQTVNEKTFRVVLHFVLIFKAHDELVK